MQEPFRTRASVTRAKLQSRTDNAIIKSVQTAFAAQIAEEAVLEQRFYSNKYYYGIVVALLEESHTPRKMTQEDEEASAGGSSFGDMVPIEGDKLNHYSAKVYVPKASSSPLPRAIIDLAAEKRPTDKDLHDSNLYPTARGQVAGTLSPGHVVKVRLVPDTDEFFIVAAFEAQGLNPCNMLKNNFDGTEDFLESTDNTVATAELRNVPPPEACADHVNIGETPAAAVWGFRLPVNEKTSPKQTMCWYRNRGSGRRHHGIDLGKPDGEVFACGEGRIKYIRNYRVYQSSVRKVYNFIKDNVRKPSDPSMPSFESLLANDSKDPCRPVITRKEFRDFVIKRTFEDKEYADRIAKQVNRFRAGTYVEIEHIGAEAKLYSRYIHITPVGTNSVGDVVESGTHIGWVSGTGVIESEQHLHFELTTDNDEVWSPYGVRPGSGSGFRKFSVNPGSLIPDLEEWVSQCPEMTPHGEAVWRSCAD